MRNNSAARVPQDVDLEDRLIFGLSPHRLLYLLGFGGLALAVMPRTSGADLLNLPICLGLAAVASLAAWGRRDGRPIDLWLADLSRYLVANYRLEISRHVLMAPVYLPPDEPDTPLPCPPPTSNTGRPPSHPSDPQIPVPRELLPARRPARTA
ncbi:MAG TPA: PrgI family protein [Candidatus Dormibacteraeota bacterium]|jgi:hypothetical protein|nr:PrgI family protein [Candidatus Dormibacteraeota bacterium]